MVDYGGIASIILAAATFVSTVGALYFRAKRPHNRDHNTHTKWDDDFDDPSEALLELLRKEDRQAEIDELLRKREERRRRERDDNSNPPALLSVLRWRIA